MHEIRLCLVEPAVGCLKDPPHEGKSWVGMPKTAGAAFPVVGSRGQDPPQEQTFLALAGPIQELVPAADELVVCGLDVGLIVGLLPFDDESRLGQPAQDFGHALVLTRLTVDQLRVGDAPPGQLAGLDRDHPQHHPLHRLAHRIIRQAVINFVGPVAERAAHAAEPFVIILTERPIVPPPLQVAAVEFAHGEGQ